MWCNMDQLKIYSLMTIKKLNVGKNEKTEN
jgi:hypothetical protein